MHPVLFKIGHIAIYSYGVMIAIAFLVGLWVASKEAKRKGMDSKLVSDFAIYALIFGVLGARLAYVIFFDFGYYLSHPLRILFVWEGGLVLYGGILGGLLAGIWFVKRHRLNFWRFADAFAPSLILGQAIGRIGCLLSGDGYGKLTTLPWGISFPGPSPAYAKFGSQPLHPTQIYELIANLTIFYILWKIRKRKSYDGFLFLLYLVVYSIARSFIESYRGDSLYILDTRIPTVWVVSILIIIISALIMWHKRGQSPTM